MLATGILLTIGTVISLWMTLDFIRPVRSNNPY